MGTSGPKGPKTPVGGRRVLKFWCPLHSGVDDDVREHLLESNFQARRAPRVDMRCGSDKVAKPWSGIS